MSDERNLAAEEVVTRDRDWRAGCECNRVGLCFRCQAANKIERLEREADNLRTIVRDQDERLRAFRDAVPPPAQPATPPSDRQPIPVTEIIAALERESANTDTDPRWMAAQCLRHIEGWEGRTLICRIDQRPSLAVTQQPESPPKR